MYVKLHTVINSKMYINMFLQWRYISRNLAQNTNILQRGFKVSSSLRESQKFDVVVVGGGIVGTASAREILLRHPTWKVAVVEKEKELAFHQTGHNSGVVHAGIYYKPGTLKAKLCVEGMQLCYKYFDEKKIPYKKVGKLIVATEEAEIPRLLDLHKRAIANGVPDVQLIDGDKIQEIEPYCEGLKALWSPHTGIVNFALVTEHYASDIREMGGIIFLDYQVNKFTESENNSEHPVTISASDTEIQLQAKYVLTCAGLQSDIIAEMTGCPKSPRIVPIRGEYLLLSKDKCRMIKGNIYPVPDPNLPFLGVHLTPRMDGSVWIGPNAVLAFKREGYKWYEINPLELIDALKYPGFLRLAAKHFRYGLHEFFKSSMIMLQAKHVQRFIPDIYDFDLSTGPAGVRAQALDMDGTLVDDFVFHLGEGTTSVAKRVLHCRNAPSPGATSSLAIEKMIADKIDVEFKI